VLAGLARPQRVEASAGFCGTSRTRTGLVSVTCSTSGILRIVRVGVRTAKWMVNATQAFRFRATMRYCLVMTFGGRGRDRTCDRSLVSRTRANAVLT
jgi:hypothetical protein